MLSPMAEEEDSNASNLLQPQQFPSPFIEVICKSSGNIRRFSVGTEASFALKLINKKLSPDQPSASYIEAYKDGEEPISFGFNSVLLDYGDGWKLQTVPDEEDGSEKQKGLVFNQHEEYSNVMALSKNHDILLADVGLHLEDPLQDLERPMGSELMSDVESQSERYDLSDYFTTDQVFNTRDELVKWTRDIGKTVGTVVVIKKSGSGLAGRAPRIAFGCERGGRYRIAKRGGVNKMPPRRKSGTKKCECPFVLRGIKLPEDDQWKVKVECGVHNHPLTRSPEGHSYGGKLTPEEEELVLELSKNGAKPKEVLNALKERDVHNLTTMHTIYCARQKLNLTRKSKRNQLTIES